MLHQRKIITVLLLLALLVTFGSCNKTTMPPPSGGTTPVTSAPGTGNGGDSRLISEIRGVSDGMPDAEFVERGSFSCVRLSSGAVEAKDRLTAFLKAAGIEEGAGKFSDEGKNWQGKDVLLTFSGSGLVVAPVGTSALPDRSMPAERFTSSSPAYLGTVLKLYPGIDGCVTKITYADGSLLFRLTAKATGETAMAQAFSLWKSARAEYRYSADGTLVSLTLYKEQSGYTAFSCAGMSYANALEQLSAGGCFYDSQNAGELVADKVKLHPYASGLVFRTLPGTEYAAPCYRFLIKTGQYSLAAYVPVTSAETLDAAYRSATAGETPGKTDAELEAEQLPSMVPVMPYPTFQYEKLLNSLDVLSLTKAQADAFFAENSAADMNSVKLRFFYERNAKNGAGFLQHPEYAVPYNAKTASENAARELSLLLPEISSSSLKISLSDGATGGYHVWEAKYTDSEMTFRSSRDIFVLTWKKPAYTLTDAGDTAAILRDLPVLTAVLKEAGLSPDAMTLLTDPETGTITLAAPSDAKTDIECQNDRFGKGKITLTPDEKNRVTTLMVYRPQSQLTSFTAETISCAEAVRRLDAGSYIADPAVISAGYLPEGKLSEKAAGCYMLYTDWLDADYSYPCYVFAVPLTLPEQEWPYDTVPYGLLYVPAISAENVLAAYQTGK